MSRTALALAALLSALAAPAAAENIYDLEHARANARAGGPVSFYDYELLERWGHLGEIDYGRREFRREYRKHRRYAHQRRWRR